MIRFVPAFEVLHLTAQGVEDDSSIRSTGLVASVTTVFRESGLNTGEACGDSRCPDGTTAGRDADENRGICSRGPERERGKRLGREDAAIMGFAYGTVRDIRGWRRYSLDDDALLYQALPVGPNVSVGTNCQVHADGDVEGNGEIDGTIVGGATGRGLISRMGCAMGLGEGRAVEIA